MKSWQKKVVSAGMLFTCLVSGIGCAGTEPESVIQDNTSEIIASDENVNPDINQGIAEEESQTAKPQVQELATQLAKAVYPEMAQYPETDGFQIDQEAYDAWRKSLQAQRPENTEYQKGIREFYQATMQEFLGDTQGKNKIYSPLNIYMALAMLAETAEGQSRQQVLDLLGADSMEELRNNAGILWNANYCDDGTVTSLLASSIWLSNAVPYQQDTLDALAEYYYASSFCGEMGSAEYNAMLQNWLNDNTGELLQEQAAKIEMDPETLFSLATTVYFRAKWANEFNEANNTEDIFHAANGDVMTEYMHQSRVGSYYWGENFGAISRKLENSGSMLLILPDEGVNVEELLTDSEVLTFIGDYTAWENQKTLIINQSVPKFDVVSDFSLIPGLKNLGVRDVFDSKVADFSPLVGDTQLSMSGATHAARVMIDEEGCTAAAFTVLMFATSARPPEETMDFILDRPFLFVINGQDGQPLFVGIVNQPK